MGCMQGIAKFIPKRANMGEKFEIITYKKLIQTCTSPTLALRAIRFNSLRQTKYAYHFQSFCNDENLKVDPFRFNPSTNAPTSAPTKLPSNIVCSNCSLLRSAEDNLRMRTQPHANTSFTLYVHRFSSFLQQYCILLQEMISTCAVRKMAV